MAKEKKVQSLKKIVSRLKKNNKKVVFTNGCFDLIHPGHIKILKSGKENGDILIVGLNSDKSVKAIKGKSRPLLNQRSRIKVLSAVKYIDYLVLFEEKTPYELIKELRPDILIKGGDWPENEIIGRKLVKKVIRVKLSPGHSTTNIIKKIKKRG